MNPGFWYRKPIRSQKTTVLLRGIATLLLVLYLSLVVGGRFA
jgi:hypothetical protein